MAKTDWSIVEADYITSSATAEELASKYGVSASAVRRRCAEGKWTRKRGEQRERDAEQHSRKMAAESRKRAQEGINALLGTATNIAQKAEEISRRAKEAAAPADIKALADALAKLLVVYRQIGGILTPAEQSAREIGLAQVKVNEQRLELERRKLKQDTGVNIIMLEEGVDDYAN